MLGTKQGKKIITPQTKYIVFDLETTGISVNNDEVIEISALKVLDGQVVDEFSTLVNPGRPIPYAASRVNGITDDMVADMPTFEDVLEEFFEFIQSDILIGHNIHTFDMKFIYRDSLKYFSMIPDNDYVDTLYMSRNCLPDLKHHSLSDLATYYSISTEGAHRALNDCMMNQKIYENLKNESKPEALESKGLMVCPRCGNVMKKRNGCYGEFMGCSSYPECKYTTKCN